MRFITKVTTINNMRNQCHIKKLKSSRTSLIGYSFMLQFHVNDFGVQGHTRISNSQIKAISRDQAQFSLFANT